MEIVLNKILSEIQRQEDMLSSQMMQTADEAYQMTLFLKEMLFTIKMKVLQTGFKDERQEINFFKNIRNDNWLLIFKKANFFINILKSSF